MVVMVQGKMVQVVGRLLIYINMYSVPRDPPNDHEARPGSNYERLTLTKR